MHCRLTHGPCSIIRNEQNLIILLKRLPVICHVPHNVTVLCKMIVPEDASDLDSKNGSRKLCWLLLSLTFIVRALSYYPFLLVTPFVTLSLFCNSCQLCKVPRIVHCLRNIAKLAKLSIFSIQQTYKRKIESTS